MNAIMPSPTHPVRPQTRLVIVRANGPLFYSVTLASFLETEATEPASRLLECLRGDGDVGPWLQGEWWNIKKSRAAALRQYVEQTWPEFEWAAAYDHYRAAIAQHGATPHRLTAANAALAGCVAAAEAGIYYRALARWSDDHDLRNLGRLAAGQEAAAFVHLRAAFEVNARRERVSVVDSWVVTRACVRYARDVHLQLAFDAVVAHCPRNAPFPVLTYIEFLARMRSVANRCAAPNRSERIIFGAWQSDPRTKAEQQAKTAGPRWFRPVLLDRAA